MIVLPANPSMQSKYMGDRLYYRRGICWNVYDILEMVRFGYSYDYENGLFVLIELALQIMQLAFESFIAANDRIELLNGFALSIDPGAVTRTVVCACDQPPEARSVGCAGDLPVLLEALSQLVGKGVGDRSCNILARLLVVGGVLSNVIHERSILRTR
jgi:hypothetical protein